MSQNDGFYHIPNVLRLCSECTPNVLRLYSDCKPAKATKGWRQSNPGPRSAIVQPLVHRNHCAKCALQSKLRNPRCLQLELSCLRACFLESDDSSTRPHPSPGPLAAIILVAIARLFAGVISSGRPLLELEEYPGYQSEAALSTRSKNWRTASRPGRPPPAKVTCDAIHAYCLSSSFCLRNT